MVNKNVLIYRLERLRDYLKILKTIQQYDISVFVKDPFVHGTAERNLHLAIECLLDIGNHVIADHEFERPENYADVFRILHQNKIIDDCLYSNLEGMASFRNVLVHDYINLDRSKVYQIIKDKTQYLEELGETFAQLL